VARKLKTPRRKSVTKPVRRYDPSGRTIGSGATTRRKTKTVGRAGPAAASRYETVTAKSGNTYKRLKPEFRAESSTNGRRKTEISPRNIYVKGKSAAISGTGTQRVTADRGGGFKGGFPPRDTTGGVVKQATQADIRAMQREMDADRNLNRAQAERGAFDERYRALKRRLSGIQGNPGRGGFGTGKKY